MDIITTIFNTIFTIVVAGFIGLVAIAIFIQSTVELRREMKPEIQDWFKTTKLGMWYSNRKNKVKVLSDLEYNQMMMSGKVKGNIVIDEQ